MSRRAGGFDSLVESRLLVTEQCHVAVRPTVGSVIDTTAEDSNLGFRREVDEPAFGVTNGQLDTKGITAPMRIATRL